MQPERANDVENRKGEKELLKRKAEGRGMEGEKSNESGQRETAKRTKLKKREGESGEQRQNEL